MTSPTILATAEQRLLALQQSKAEAHSTSALDETLDRQLFEVEAQVITASKRLDGLVRAERLKRGLRQVQAERVTLLNDSAAHEETEWLNRREQQWERALLQTRHARQGFFSWLIGRSSRA